MMKRWISALCLCFLVAACTSEERKLEEMALDGATQQFQAELKEELAKAITGKVNLQFTASDILTKRTEFAVLKKNVDGSMADFDVQAKTIPVKAKNALIEIISRLDEAKANRFNVPDALTLIYQQWGLSPEDTTTLTYKVKLKKDGVWKIQAPL